VLKWLEFGTGISFIGKREKMADAGGWTTEIDIGFFYFNTYFFLESSVQIISYI
jgi:hypothetical protein